MKFARALAGILVSVAFAYGTLSRVDLGEAAGALAHAAPPALAIAFLFLWLEVAVRAWRWRFLLGSLGRVGYGQAFAYTCVGYFSNTLLPMRLGDVARAYLAATALRLSRVATVGSVVAERLADGITILAVALGLGFVVLGESTFDRLGPVLALAAVGGATLVGATFLVARRRGLLSLIPARALMLAARLVDGAAAARTPSGAATLVVSTLAAYACAVGAFAAIAGAVDLQLTPAQAAFAMAWIALSTAIPAAPGSVGTYEFIGVGALTLVGQDPGASLAAVVLLHVMGTLPVALAGLVATWALHLRVMSLGGAEDVGEAAAA
jgi:glycosyltransferase 2 family protein